MMFAESTRVKPSYRQSLGYAFSQIKLQVALGVYSRPR